MILQISFIFYTIFLENLQYRSFSNVCPLMMPYFARSQILTEDVEFQGLRFKTFISFDGV